MANTSNLQILRSYANSSPTHLLDGQLAYSFVSNTLFIGSNSNANNLIVVGGATPLAAIQTAFNSANISGDFANTAFLRANAAFATANAAATATTTNNAYATANLAFAQANAAYNAANSGVTASYAFNQANIAFTQANNSFNVANSGAVFANGAFTQANNSLNVANSGAVFANGAFTQANNAYNKANSANVLAQSAFNAANVGNTFVNTGGTVTGNVTVSNNLTVSGNLYVLGNLTAINTTQEETNAPLIFLANNNTTSDTVDIGFVGNYNATGNAFTGLFRNPALKEFIFFQNYASPIGSNNLINISDPSFAYANVYANVFKGNVISHGVDLFYYANAGYAFANSINVYAYASYASQNITATFANSAFTQANASYNVANSGAVFANGAFVTANSGASFANGAFVVANSAAIFANGAFVTANSGALFANGAFVTANSAASFANGAFTTANSAASFANSAFTTANSASSNTIVLQGIENAQNTNITSAFAQANAAFNAANNASGGSATSAFNQANLAYQQANNAYNAANSGASSTYAYNQANLAYQQANNAYNAANSGASSTYAYNQANIAFTQANSAYNVANSGAVFANGAFVVANASYNFANSVNTYAYSSYASQNITAGFANASYSYANTLGVNLAVAFNVANAAYANSNSFITFITGVETSQNSNIASAFTQANNAAIFANGAFTVANAAVIRAGDTMTGNLVIAGGNLTVGTAFAAFANGNVNISQPNGQIVLKANTYAGHFLPAANADGTGVGYDLGSATSRWRKIYISGATIDLGGSLISAQGNGVSFATVTATGGIESVNTNTGSIIITGGIGVSNNAFIGGNTTISYQLTANQHTFGLDGTSQYTAAAPYAYSNASFLTANSAYNSQNITASFTNSAFLTANSSYTSQNITASFANSAYTQANSASVFANGSFTTANSASSNTVTLQGIENAQNTNISSAFTFANSVNVYAYSAYGFANTVNVNTTAAFAFANSVNVYAYSAYAFANAVNVNTTAAFAFANSVNTYAYAAFAYANTLGNFNVQAVYNTANNASNTANIAYSNATAAFTFANSVNTYAYSAYNFANNINVYAYSAYAAANVGNTFVSTGGTVAGSVVISTDLHVTGNLYIAGNSTFVNANNISTNDSIILIGTNNTSNAIDLGIVGHFTNNGYQRTGFVRNHNTGIWGLFSNLTSEPTTTINWSDANLIYDKIQTGNITTPAVYVSGVELGAYSNSINAYAYSSYSQANSASANTVTTQGVDNTQNTNIGYSWTTANAAFANANSAILYQTAISNSVNSIAVGGAPVQNAQTWSTFTVSQVFDAILFPTIGPTYTIPTISLSGTASGTVEVGSTITQTMTLTGTKNDAGAFLALYIQRNSANIATISNPSGTATTNIAAQYGYSDPNNQNYYYTLSNTDTAIATTGTFTWAGYGNYNAGVAKLTNKGQTDANAAQLRSTVYPQTAGSAFASGSYSVTGIYPYFWGVSSSQPTAASIASAIQAGTANKVLAAGSGNTGITFAASSQYVWFAIQTTYAAKTTWYNTALNNGSIGAGQFILSPVTQAVTSPTSLWSGINFNIYISGYATTTSGAIYFN